MTDEIPIRLDRSSEKAREARAAVFALLTAWRDTGQYAHELERTLGECVAGVESVASVESIVALVDAAVTIAKLLQNTVIEQSGGDQRNALDQLDFMRRLESDLDQMIAEHKAAEG